MSSSDLKPGQTPPDLKLSQFRDIQTSVLKTLGYTYNSEAWTYSHQPLSNYLFMIRELSVFEYEGQIREIQRGDNIFETKGFSPTSIALELYNAFINIQVSNHLDYFNQYNKQMEQHH
jgi:hypothetical protein